MIIEPAIAADVDALAALVNAAYRGASAEQGWTHEAVLLDGQRTDAGALAALLATDRARILVLRDKAGGPPAGCVCIEPTAAASTWSLGLLTVAPGRQDQGLGRALIAAAEDAARTLGASTIRMTVIHLRDQLIAFYERRGYRRTGETAPFPYGDETVGRPRRADLRFVVLDKILDKILR